jgi:putative membrane protein
MKLAVWLFKWVLKTTIFFTLFAFALNNQTPVTLEFFLGWRWKAPMVLVVLGSFALGLLVGVLGMLGMLPMRRRTQPPVVAPAPSPTDSSTPMPTPLSDHGI